MRAVGLRDDDRLAAVRGFADDYIQRLIDGVERPLKILADNALAVVEENELLVSRSADARAMERDMRDLHALISPLAQASDEFSWEEFGKKVWLIADRAIHRADEKFPKREPIETVLSVWEGDRSSVLRAVFSLDELQILAGGIADTYSSWKIRERTAEKRSGGGKSPGYQKLLDQEQSIKDLLEEFNAVVLGLLQDSMTEENPS